MTGEISGARHQRPWRKRLKMVMSRSCAARKAAPEPMATRRVTRGPNSPCTCVPMKEQTIPVTKPASTTLRAAAGPSKRFTISFTRKAKG